jgi:hypothetical protein
MYRWYEQTWPQLVLRELGYLPAYLYPNDYDRRQALYQRWQERAFAERYGALDKRLRAGRAQATVVDEVLARPDLTASGAAATAALALEDLKIRHLALSADLWLLHAERPGGGRDGRMSRARIAHAQLQRSV